MFMIHDAHIDDIPGIAAVWLQLELIPIHCFVNSLIEIHTVEVEE
jgi:hypothetical protein